MTPSGDGEMAWRCWGSGPPVVLLHGAHGSWTHWIRNIDQLAANTTIVVPDLPGHGDSALTAEPGAGPSLVQTLAAGLGRILGPDAPYLLVGFSFGATIGARLAHHEGDRVRSLVVISLGGFGDRARLRMESVRRLSEDDEINAAHRRNLEILMVADPAAIDAETIRIQRENVERARIEPRDVHWPTTTPAEIQALAVPVVAIYGERDPTIVPSAAHRRDELLGFRPDADVRIVAGAGHWVQYEAPGAVNAIIRERSQAR
jgi:pimeloyl-ACP methyl ester carboxylesterase